jgi:membrane associated rhomboid family serine protease
MFGKGIERLYGRWNFLAFYLAAGVAAGLLFVVTSLLNRDPRPAVGASGAVMGVVVLYAFHFPRQRVYVWGIVPVLIWQLAIFFVGIDLLYFLGGSQGNIANAAHLGGAAFGAIYRFVDLRTDRFLALWKRLAARPAGTPPPPPRAPGASPVDPAGRARVDALLDKISKDGLSSLTDEERAFLRDASNQYRT